MKAAIKGISYYLPSQVLNNDELAAIFPEWPAEKIFEKTGIKQRHIASYNETSMDLAACAAKDLFNKGICSPEEIEMVILCTQSPDYYLPTTACMIQNELRIPSTAGAFDFNLGCSGYIYGLSIAKGYIESGIVKNVLFLTGETYSKFIHSNDKSVRTIFGDAGTATFIESVDTDNELIGPFIFGTDGSGSNGLITPIGGFRYRTEHDYKNAGGLDREDGIPIAAIFMDGPGIFAFTLKVVPKMLKDLYKKSGLSQDNINLFVFHQANKFMLDNLCRQSKIPRSKFFIDFEDIGNTVSNTIPIALSRATEKGSLPSGGTIMLVGFGVGLSWGACLVKGTWSNDGIE